MSQPTQSEQREAKRRALAEVLQRLVGKNLLQEGFSIEKLVEVYRVNDDGRMTSSVGFFRDENLAKAFAQNQTDAAWHKTREVFALTDGNDVFQLMAEDAPIYDSEKAELEIRMKALAKLSPEEKKLLGL